jgi:hypothetical protein
VVNYGKIGRSDGLRETEVCVDLVGQNGNVEMVVAEGHVSNGTVWLRSNIFTHLKIPIRLAKFCS